MMANYQERLSASGTITTSAVAGTNVATNVLAALPAGQRYRLFNISINKLSLAVAAQLAATVRGQLSSGVQPACSLLAIQPGRQSDNQNFENVGFPGQSGAGVTLSHSSDAVSIGFVWSIQYTIEVVP